MAKSYDIKGSDGRVRKFNSWENWRLWSSIYSTLSSYGGFYQQARATDELYSLHNKTFTFGRTKK